MKRIKLFESYSKYDIIIEDLNDILMELSDNLYNIEIKKPCSKNIYMLNISIIRVAEENKATPFSISEIIEYILRIDDYLEQVDHVKFKLEIVDACTNKPRFTKIELGLDIENWDINQELILLNLYFIEEN